MKDIAQTYYDNETRWKWLLFSVMGSKAYDRLCECRSFKRDIPLLAKCYKRFRNISSEDALTIALEHFGANNQIFNYTENDWNRWIKSVEKF